MGCDIHYMVQIEESPGKWVNRPDWKFFDGRSYNLFGVLANVRNLAKLPYISEPRGFPPDVEFDLTDDSDILGRWMGDHSYTWLTLDELLKFDYDQLVINRRDFDTRMWQPLRDLLPNEYFTNLQQLQYDIKYANVPLTPKKVRILIGFDN